MEFKKYNNIQINGKLLSGDKLVQLCKHKIGDTVLPLWEKSIYQFINEWLADTDYILVKTSGSTSTPKSIKLSKELLIHSAKATVNFLNLKPNMNALLCLSAEHIAGKMMIVRAFVSNFNLIVIEPDSDPIRNLNTKIDFAAMIPLQVVISLKTEIKKLRNINNLIIGGGRIDPRLHKKLLNFPNKVYATYGMTETATHIALKLLNSTNPEE
ncbi:MAG: AMP-binding protein, partial [Bacteroidetes bacterium]|nr:AMP-binding protein [Bacteroidota bacterium]